MTNYAQPRVERNGCAMGNAARFFNRDVLPRVFRVKNAIRTRIRWAAGERLAVISDAEGDTSGYQHPRPFLQHGYSM